MERDETRKEKNWRSGGVSGKWKGKGPLRVEPAKYLLDDFVEEAVWELRLDLLLEPPVGGEVCDAVLVRRACAAGEKSDDATIPGEDDGPRVTSIGKPAVRPVVGQDGDLVGGVLDAVVTIGASE